MAFSSEVGLPPGTRPGDADRYDVAGQTSFERFSSGQLPLPLWDKPTSLGPTTLGGRSISAEEGMVALTLLNCGKQRTPSQSNDADLGGGGRCDSGAWPMVHLLETGGEGVPNVQSVGGPREPETCTAADRKDAQLLLRSTSGGSGGIGAPRAEQHDTREMQEMQELEASMPDKAPFGGFSSSSGRSNSRKARLAASRNDVSNQPIWRTGDSSSLSRLLDDFGYKSSSGSGSSGGGGPGVAHGTTHAGGSSSNGASGGGGGGGGGRSASWERRPRPGAGGAAATTHDGIIIDRNSSSSGGSRVPPKPLRQQSFDPHCKIPDSSLADVCLMPDTKPQPPPAAPGGFVQDWERAAVAPSTTGTTERSGISNGGIPYGAQHIHYAHHTGVSPALSCNSDQGYAPTGATRQQQVAPPPTPRPVYPEWKSSFNLLASMIPDISKVGGRPSAPMAAAPAWTGAAGCGGIVGRFNSPGVPSMTHMEEQSEGGATVWTRQAALARYHRKRKRRPFVKAMRENDPNRKEQNKARERPRDGGKFRKKGKDFVSVKELQRAGDNRSVSNELPPPPARDSTPPPSKIRSLNGRPSQEGDAAGPPVGGGDSGGSLYLLTPDQAAKLGLKERDNR